MARHRNHGLRKRCGCPRTKWPKCSHGWHVNFGWKGVKYRLSLDRECGRRITSKTEAEQEADRIRHAIRQGSYWPGAVSASSEKLTFRQFVATWQERRGVELVNARDNAYRIKRLCAFVVPATRPPLVLGDKPLDAVTTDDVEALRDARKAAGLSRSPSIRTSGC